MFLLCCSKTMVTQMPSLFQEIICEGSVSCLPCSERVARWSHPSDVADSQKDTWPTWPIRKILDRSWTYVVGMKFAIRMQGLKCVKRKKKSTCFHVWAAICYTCSMRHSFQTLHLISKSATCHGAFRLQRATFISSKGAGLVLHFVCIGSAIGEQEKRLYST